MLSIYRGNLSICSTEGGSYLLDVFELKSLVYYKIGLSKPWKVLVPERLGLVRFHCVLKGRSYLYDERTHRFMLLSSGDVVFVLAEGKQYLVSSKRKPTGRSASFCDKIYLDVANSPYETRIDTSILCGQIEVASFAKRTVADAVSSGLHLKRKTMNSIQIPLVNAMIEANRFGANEALAIRLVEALFISAMESGDTIGKPGIDHIKGTVALINKKFSEQIDWSSIILKSGLTKTVFFRRFKEATGLSPHAYLNSVRMKKARILLESTDMQIKTIFSEVGFGTIESFSKKFKSVYGVSPSQVRRAHR